ncbi:Mu transposase C-terminal domain-containing protein [Methylogaea oryzae]|uniref:Mu transposase C-terminal domain-containing protein n=1 Tax=Methylogaea oryzae TaxID=1295382 RepID=UPI000AC756B2|nr:Mu transposase C-terminal domain-containing protein [Methylogaea oryzae]
MGVDAATLYRWLKRYKAYGAVSALIPQRRGWKTGKSRIPVFAEEVIEEVIRDFYLTPQRPTAQKAVMEVFRRCEQRGIEAPSAATIRSRLNRVTEKQRLRGRGFKEKAKNKFLPAAGSFPNADYPLAVVQIDHTPADIILVDDVYRRPIGRPWITLSMDVYSRMVTGYYLSFDPPSETSVAMCVTHSVLPKDEWLLLHKVDAQWPVWGFPKTIHVDNGADFRSNNFQQSCLMYGINLEFRPVKQPRYGGHIERVLGTLLKEIHDLPGTTFSSIREKDEYNPEKHAAMTKSEFETWLVTLICKVYHQRLHSGIGMSPLKKWEIGIFGNAEVQGTGIPPRPANRLTVLLDFLPAFRRTVQTFGVTIDGMSYYAEALRPWINAEDPDARDKKREFIFRRDPRDISAVWFFDPALQQYFKVPFADQSLPSMSIWEYQQARETLKREGKKSVNEHQILHAITELRSRVDEAKEKTKKARRQAQRRTEHEKKVSPAAPMPAEPLKPSAPLLAPVTGLVEGDIDASETLHERLRAYPSGFSAHHVVVRQGTPTVHGSAPLDWLSLR